MMYFLRIIFEILIVDYYRILDDKYMNIINPHIKYTIKAYVCLNF